LLFEGEINVLPNSNMAIQQNGFEEKFNYFGTNLANLSEGGRVTRKRGGHRFLITGQLLELLVVLCFVWVLVGRAMQPVW